MKNLITISLASLLIACSSGEDAHTNHSTNHASEFASGIIISNARVRPPLPGRDVATAYFTIMNSGPADQIVTVKTPLSERVELHTHLNEDGVMKMRRVTAVDIPENENLEFKPGSYHVMIFGAQIANDQNDVSLTLEFANADPVTLIADIDDGTMSKSMEHEGH